MRAFTLPAAWILVLALLSCLAIGPKAVSAVPAVRNIALENGIIPCPSGRHLTILPVDNSDGVTLGQLAIESDVVPPPTYTYTLELDLPDNSVVITTDGLVQLNSPGGLGPDKAVGFKAKASPVQPASVGDLSQFFLVQMI
ncbi:uncharacterized protein EV422DRAFT_504306 [Fimicolochytrium jonesii]|uniref:uncharacterized protein n=1 Tax=Fimicolochytrium jonesii TaxID=1396493 RepID=UPI0022FEB109|nr:uncharacterized protein EV422DRAFT_504306 [Fimicolochytrium jonesii]KAI8824287.1 hypothetical protein EV422DRAFT_504306 [Fimicolochytrium jonesii]